MPLSSPLCFFGALHLPISSLCFLFSCSPVHVFYFTLHSQCSQVYIFLTYLTLSLSSWLPRSASHFLPPPACLPTSHLHLKVLCHQSCLRSCVALSTSNLPLRPIVHLFEVRLIPSLYHLVPGASNSSLPLRPWLGNHALAVSWPYPAGGLQRGEGEARDVEKR